MTGKRGRKPISEVERLQQAQTARRVVDEELAAMRSAGLMPSEGKAKANAARRLGVGQEAGALAGAGPCCRPSEETDRSAERFYCPMGGDPEGGSAGSSV